MPNHEDSESQRLMMRLADESLVRRIEELPARKGSMAEKHELRLLQAVLQTGKDLRDQFKPI